MICKVCIVFNRFLLFIFLISVFYIVLEILISVWLCFLFLINCYNVKCLLLGKVLSKLVRLVVCRLLSSVLIFKVCLVNCLLLSFFCLFWWLRMLLIKVLLFNKRDSIWLCIFVSFFVLFLEVFLVVVENEIGMIGIGIMCDVCVYKMSVWVWKFRG